VSVYFEIICNKELFYTTYYKWSW